MDSADQSIGEVDYVAFTEEIDEDEGTGRWPAGTRGTVVDDLGDQKMVEICNTRGEALDMPIVPVQKLKLIKKHPLVSPPLPGRQPHRLDMTAKEQLHKLVDELSDAEASRARLVVEDERFLRRLRKLESAA